MMSIYKPYDDPVYPFWGIIATSFYAGIFYWGMDQVNVQRVLAAPDLDNARWGAMFATFLKLLPVFLFVGDRCNRVCTFSLENWWEMLQDKLLSLY